MRGLMTNSHPIRPIAQSLALLVLVLPLSARAAEVPPTPSEPVPLHPCHVEGTTEEVRCATYVVFEDRESREGRRIPLNIVVLPALGGKPSPDPIFFLAGGPGEAATTTVDWLKDLKGLRQDREIVLVDQRGTGGSNPLGCEFYGRPVDLIRAAGDFYPPAEVRTCRHELAKRANLALYTTAMAMDDLDEVRAWFGYPKINLYGGSYGTQAAQVYLRRHAATVRAVVLDGIAPVDELIPLHHAYAGQRALNMLFAECAADAACKAAFPHPAEELKEVLARIDRGVDVQVTDRRTGKPVTVRPTRGLVAEGIRFFLYFEAEGGNTLPLQIHRAFQGDLTPLVQTSLDRRLRMDRGLEMGMLFSVTCAEDLPFIDLQTVGRETAGTFLGDYRVRQQLAVCATWPRGHVPPDVHELVRSDLPVLLISGERDPVTPPEFGARVASRLPNSLHLVLPHGSHGGSGTGPCVDGLVRDFVARGTVKGLDPSCVQKLPPPKFATAWKEEKKAG